MLKLSRLKTSAGSTVRVQRAVVSRFFKPTGRPSLEFAPTTSATFLDDREFSAGCFLFTVSNSRLLFSHGRPSQQLLSSCFPLVTLMFDL